MKDLRIIRLDGEKVELVGDGLDEPINGLEAAVQRIVVALLMTPGTVMDAPTWGGGAYRLFLKQHKNDIDTKESAKSVVRQASRSLERSEPEDETFAVTDLSLEDVDTSPDRGYDIVLRARFQNASAQSLKIPSGTYGTT